MIGAHQNLDGSRDLTTPLSEVSGMVCNPLALATINLPTKFEALSLSSLTKKI